MLEPEAPQPPSLRAILAEPPLWALPAVALLLFFPQLFLGRSLYYRDLYAYFLPQQRLMADFLAAVELPLWDPYLHGGQAYLANIANFAWYPSNLLHLALPLLRAFNLTIAVHVALASVTVYIFARSLGMRRASSVLAGIVYAYSGYSLSLVNLLNLHLAWPYLPLLATFWHRHLLERRRRWFLLAVGAGVLQILPGAPEANALTLLFLLGWGLFHPYPGISRLRVSGRWALLCALILAASAFVLLPALPISAASVRGEGLDVEMVGAWSLYPSRLPELVLPEFFGSHVRSLDPAAYWGSSLMRERAPTFPSIYLGALAVFLALLGATLPGAARGLPSRTRAFLVAMALGCLVLSLGRFLPFFGLLLRHVSPLGSFRFPVKMLMGAILPLALLAARAPEALLARPAAGTAPSPGAPSRRPPVPVLAIGWGFAALLAGAAATFLWAPDLAARLARGYFGSDVGPLAVAGLAGSFGHAAGIWTVAVLLLQAHRTRPRQWHHGALVGVVAVDLLVAGARVNPSAPDAFFLDEPPAVDAVRRELGDGRLYRSEGPPSPRLRVPSDDLVWYHRYRLETLDADLGAFYRLPVIFHDDLVKLSPARLVRLRETLASLPWERRLPLLAAGGVTVVLSPETVDVPGLVHVEEVANRSDVPLHLYRMEAAAARAAFVPDRVMVSSGEEALGAMLAPGYDPRRTVVLETEGADRLTIGGADPDCAPADGEVSWEARGDRLWRLRVTSRCGGTVAFAEPYYPGWTVEVDGRPASLLRANHAFSAVRVPPGEHVVERRYVPGSLAPGVAVSLGAAGILGLAWRRRWI